MRRLRAELLILGVIFCFLQICGVLLAGANCRLQFHAKGWSVGHQGLELLIKMSFY